MTCGRAPPSHWHSLCWIEAARQSARLWILCRCLRSARPHGTRGQECGECLLCPHATCATHEQVPGLDSLRDAWLREAAVEAAAAEAAAAALNGTAGVAGPAETRAAVAAVVRAAGAASDAADALGAPPCGSCKECRTPCQARPQRISHCAIEQAVSATPNTLQLKSDCQASPVLTIRP